MTSIDAQIVEILLKAEIQPQPLSIEQQQQRQIRMQGADESLAGGGITQSDRAAEPEQVNRKNGIEVTVRRKLSNDNSENAEPNQIATPSPFGHVGRNDPCPCGSGKKFKKCHGK